MTAYVVWGLSIARDAKLDVRLDAITRGAQYLSLEIVQAERTPDLAAFELFALGSSGFAKQDPRVEAAFTKLWEQKNALNAYGRALFALALTHWVTRTKPGPCARTSRTARRSTCIRMRRA